MTSSFSQTVATKVPSCTSITKETPPGCSFKIREHKAQGNRKKKKENRELVMGSHTGRQEHYVLFYRKDDYELPQV